MSVLDEKIFVITAAVLKNEEQKALNKKTQTRVDTKFLLCDDDKNVIQ